MTITNIIPTNYSGIYIEESIAGGEWWITDDNAGDTFFGRGKPTPDDVKNYADSLPQVYR